MNSFKKLIVLALCVLFLTKASLADSHDVNKELVEKAKEITKNLENNEVEEEEDVPLNDPFAGNEGSTSTINPPAEEQENELSLYNFKLAGLISGKDYSYISLVNTAGEVMTITLGQYLGKIQLVDLRLNEAIFKKEDESFIIIDFNNQIREANEY